MKLPPPSQEAIDFHDADILARAKQIVLAHHKHAVAELWIDGRWTICLSPTRLTFMCWSASERDVWIDCAILLATGEVYPLLTSDQAGNDAPRKNRVRELEYQLEWQMITKDYLPRVGDEVGGWFGIFSPRWEVRPYEDYGFSPEITVQGCKIAGWTHYRPINQPEKEDL